MPNRGGIVFFLLPCVVLSQLNSKHTHSLYTYVYKYELPSKVCRVDYLLTITNKTTGIDISLFSEDEHQTLPPTDPTNYNYLHLQQHFVSPECHRQQLQSRNCQIITFSTNRAHHQIAMVPLLNALLVVDIDTREMIIQLHTALPIASCSPMAVFAILDSFYTVCVDLSMNRVHLYEVRVDSMKIERSYLSGELATVELADPPEVSNFVFANLSQHSDDQKIYFASRDSLFEFTPLSFHSSYTGSLGRCSPVQNLVYLGDWVLLAHCSDGSLVYFDINDQAVESVENTAIDGQLIVCPHSYTNLRLYSHSGNSSTYLQYSSQAGAQRHIYELPGSNYNTGTCFAAESTTYFAFIDSQEGAFVFDLETSNVTQVSFESCQPTQCYPPLVINSSFLVIQEQSNVKVFRRETNHHFQEVITVPHISAQMLAVLAWEYECMGVESLGTVTPSERNRESSYETTIKTVVLPIVGLLLILSLIIIIVTGSVIVYLIVSKKRHQRRQQRRRR